MSTKQLVQRRALIKGQLTRLKNSLTQEEQTPAEARVKMKKLEEMWVNFEEIQFKILEDKMNKLELRTELQDEEKEAQQRQIEKESKKEMGEFEKIYFETASRCQSSIDQPRQHRENQQREPRGNEHSMGVKLPTLKLPEFKRDNDKWLLFEEAYKSMIHTNTGLADSQKFQYLTSALSGEALQVVNSLERSENNYRNAWELLMKTYENKKLLINTHLNQLLDFPTIGKDKPRSIKKLIVHTRSHLRALKTLELPVEHWDELLIHLIKGKLDYHTQKDWEGEVNRDKDKKFLLEDFLTFLSERCHTLELVNGGKNKQENFKQEKDKKFEKKVLLASISHGKCIICQESHAIFKCPEFLKQTVADRITEVRSKKLCMNCLSTGHYALACKASTCKKCHKKHNTLLHLETNDESTNQKGLEQEESTSVITHCTQSKKNESYKEPTPSSYFLRNSMTYVILSTALVQVEDADENQHVCRILLNPGSQSNLITESLVRRLKLKGKRQNEKISGVNRSEINASRIVVIKIKSRLTSYQTTLECLTLPTITERLPQVKINLKSIQLPSDVPLADPKFYEPNSIDILVGAGIFWKLLCQNSIKRPKGLPALQKTLLGWIVGGELIQTRQESKSKVCGMIRNDNLQHLLERFWEQEEIKEEKKFTEEELECERQFLEAVHRDNSGRYIVPLPKKPEITLGDTEEIAKKRLFN